MTTPKAIIGSYADPKTEGTKEPEIIDKRPAPVATPERNIATGIREDLEQEVKKSEDVVTKIKDYKEILKEANIDLSEAMAIVDDILTNGYYEEIIPLTKNITVTLRTRTQSDYLRYHRALEMYSPRYQDELQEIARRYCLAGSLVRFGDKEFTHADNPRSKEAGDFFDARLEWIEEQSDQIINLLQAKLYQFDSKIMTVMSEGVVENF